jgi:hypothetical protein
VRVRANSPPPPLRARLPRGVEGHAPVPFGAGYSIPELVKSASGFAVQTRVGGAGGLTLLVIGLLVAAFGIG